MNCIKILGNLLTSEDERIVKSIIDQRLIDGINSKIRYSPHKKEFMWLLSNMA